MYKLVFVNVVKKKKKRISYFFYKIMYKIYFVITCILFNMTNLNETISIKKFIKLFLINFH